MDSSSDENVHQTMKVSNSRKGKYPMRSSTRSNTAYLRTSEKENEDPDTDTSSDNDSQSAFNSFRNVPMSQEYREVTSTEQSLPSTSKGFYVGISLETFNGNSKKMEEQPYYRKTALKAEIKAGYHNGNNKTSHSRHREPFRPGQVGHFIRRSFSAVAEANNHKKTLMKIEKEYDSRTVLEKNLNSSAGFKRNFPITSTSRSCPKRTPLRIPGFHKDSGVGDLQADLLKRYDVSDVGSSTGRFYGTGVYSNKSLSNSSVSVYGGSSTRGFYGTGISSNTSSCYNSSGLQMNHTSPSKLRLRKSVPKRWTRAVSKLSRTDGDLAKYLQRLHVTSSESSGYFSPSDKHLNLNRMAGPFVKAHGRTKTSRSSKGKYSQSLDIIPDDSSNFDEESKPTRNDELQSDDLIDSTEVTEGEDSRCFIILPDDSSNFDEESKPIRNEKLQSDDLIDISGETEDVDTSSQNHRILPDVSSNFDEESKPTRNDELQDDDLVDTSGGARSADFSSQNHTMGYEDGSYLVETLEKYASIRQVEKISNKRHNLSDSKDDDDHPDIKRWKSEKESVDVESEQKIALKKSKGLESSQMSSTCPLTGELELESQRKRALKRRMILESSGISCDETGEPQHSKIPKYQTREELDNIKNLEGKGSHFCTIS